MGKGKRKTKKSIYGDNNKEVKYIKFMPYNTVSNASRNRREMDVANEFGFDVYCYSRDRFRPDSVSKDSFQMICDDTPIVSSSLHKIHRIGRILANKYRHMKKLRRLEMDVISCHNLDALEIAWWSRIGLKNKPKLIYDSHEFELYKKKRNRLEFLITFFRERFLIRQVVFSIMVNNGIADEVKRIYHLKTDPVVVRSTSEYWEKDNEEVQQIRDEYCCKLGIDQSIPIIIYTGYLKAYRGLEELLEAMSIVSDFCVVFVGEADNQAYGDKITKLVEQLGVSNRILWYPFQPHDELYKYIAAAAAAIVMNDKSNRNYYYALPNKFFEAIQSETPIICTDSQEMRAIVNKYNIGMLVQSGNKKELAITIEKLFRDSETYNKYKENITKAKEKLCWEKEKKRLLKAYRDFL